MRVLLTLEEARNYLQEHPYGKLRAIYDDPLFGKRTATICNGTLGTMALAPKRRRFRGKLQ